MHYKIFLRRQKMTKIVAQHILKCITWALFSNTMCPLHQCLSKLKGSSIIKGSVKKFMFISNFLRGFFTMKVVENSPQNARNCTFFKIFLRGGMPPNPPSKARSFAARDMFKRNPKNFKVGPPLRNPAYAPGYMYRHNKCASHPRIYNQPYFQWKMIS